MRHRSKPMTVAAAALLLVGAPLCAQTLLGPSHYLCFDSDATTATGDCGGNDNPFKDVVFSWVIFKDYEDQVLESPGVTITTAPCPLVGVGCPLISTDWFSDSATDSVDEDNGEIDGSGQTVGGRGRSVWGKTFLTFTFDPAVLGEFPTLVGIVWTDGGVGTTEFEAWDDAGVSLGGLIANLEDGWNSGTTVDDTFFGAVHTGGISAITLTNSSGGIEIDHLLYGVAPGWDGDGDGFDFLVDCDDLDALTYPGAPERCDGLDNDCDAVVPANETTDGDMDGAILCDDCDDGDPLRFPGNAESCDNVDNDCDGAVDGFATACGVGGCSAPGVCTAGSDSCTPGAPVPESCDGIDNDCDGGLPVPEQDVDADGVMECGGDCDDAVAETYPEAPESNDGLDNQCAGDEGFGLVDEISGSLDLPNAVEVCWPAQAGAASYQVIRADAGDLTACTVINTAGTCWFDIRDPAPGGHVAYLVRAVVPWTGSWGTDSSGLERVVSCAAE